MRVKPLLAILLLLLPLSAAAERSPGTANRLLADVTTAIKTESAAQREYTAWDEQRDAASAELRDMKAMEDWLSFQNKKYTEYLKRQKAVIAELERRKEEVRRIRMELEPYLEVIVDRMDAFVGEDLPFLPEERQARVAFLRDSLSDYHLELSEKLRRVFEALHVETEYGRTVEVTTTELPVDGVPTQVSLFRLGRTALYYVTADGSGAGMWDQQGRSWKTLDGNAARTLRRAEEMAARKRAVELLDLPVEASR